MTSMVSEKVGGIDGARAARYAAVSVAGTVVTQILLVTGHAVAGMGPATANSLAVMAVSIPVFFVNRSWVWAVSGPSSIRREVVPFWAFTIAGLVLSTLVVGGVASLTDRDLALAAANVGSFGLLWMAKFFVLDEVVFAPVSVEDLAVA